MFSAIFIVTVLSSRRRIKVTVRRHGGVSIVGFVVVVNNFYPLHLAHFLRDEKTHCEETSHKQTS